MATFTASELTSPAKTLHAGVQSKSSVLTISTTATAASILMLAKIPNGATVVNFLWRCDDGGADQTYTLGVRYPEGDTSYSTVADALLGATSISTVVPAGAIWPDNTLPYKFSFSQGNRESYGWIVATPSAALSSSAISKFTVFYTMDGS